MNRWIKEALTIDMHFLLSECQDFTYSMLFLAELFH